MIRTKSCPSGSILAANVNMRDRAFECGNDLKTCVQPADRWLNKNSHICCRLLARIHPLAPTRACACSCTNVQMRRRSAQLQRSSCLSNVYKWRSTSIESSSLVLSFIIRSTRPASARKCVLRFSSQFSLSQRLLSPMRTQRPKAQSRRAAMQKSSSFRTAAATAAASK